MRAELSAPPSLRHPESATNSRVFALRLQRMKASVPPFERAGAVPRNLPELSAFDPLRPFRLLGGYCPLR